MRPKVIAALLLIVLVPLGLLAWMGARVGRDEQEIVQHKFRELLLGKLRDIDDGVAALLDERARALLAVTDLSSFEPGPLRRLVQQDPILQQIFVLGPDGKRLYPPPEGPLNSAERDFLERAGQIWKDQQAFYRAANDSTAARGYGWYTWYWGSGINLLFWRRTQTGAVVGAELNRVRLMADIVGKLPVTDPFDPALPDGRIALLDSKGATLYQWGSYEPADGEDPMATLALKEPLSAWKLQYFASSADLDKAVGGSIFLALISGILVVGVALTGLVVYLYRETSREVREALQRVNFVNQVSHELKTPLTNIRMYAELLETHPEADEERRARYLEVIVSESQRLSRLIANVLTFAREQRDKLSLHLAEGKVDDLVRSVVEDFRPSLEARGVKVDFQGDASAAVRFDADALEQILANLFCNVEKYAAAGGLMQVATRQNGEATTITVADRGPGIPPAERESVFKPFHRLSNRLTDGAAGAGIGLSIARSLARLHGGDLTIEPSQEGACFKAELHTPRA